MKKVLTSAAVGAAALLVSAGPALGAHEGSVYTADLGELNDSGATGSATVTVSEDGETMSVEITASGLALDGPHAQHIHGIVDGETVSASACPTEADDEDGDGVLTVVEGVPQYGNVQVSLTTEGDTSADSGLAVERFPAGTTLNYSRSGIPIPDALKPNLGKLHIVVHGIDENGNGTLDMDQTERSSLDDSLPREATAPALCGTLTAQATGVVQTGAGGLATEQGTDLDALALTLAGLGVAGVAGTAALRMRRVEA